MIFGRYALCFPVFRDAIFQRVSFELKSAGLGLCRFILRPGHFDPPRSMFMPIALALALPVVVYYQKFSLRRLFIYLAVLSRDRLCFGVSRQIYRNVVEYNTFDLTPGWDTPIILGGWRSNGTP